MDPNVDINALLNPIHVVTTAGDNMEQNWIFLREFTYPNVQDVPEFVPLNWNNPEVMGIVPEITTNAQNYWVFARGIANRVDPYRDEMSGIREEVNHFWHIPMTADWRQRYDHLWQVYKHYTKQYQDVSEKLNEIEKFCETVIQYLADEGAPSVSLVRQFIRVSIQILYHFKNDFNNSRGTVYALIQKYRSMSNELRRQDPNVSDQDKLKDLRYN